MKDIEDTYTEINTGNLVIGAFVSNFKNIAETNGISFSPTLKIDANRIPINDYDLCVILGNLLDNSFNACRKNAAGHNYIALTISVNENDIFYIHIENTYDPAEECASRPKTDFLKHGYGMDNIETIVEKNHGYRDPHHRREKTSPSPREKQSYMINFFFSFISRCAILHLSL